MHGYEQNHFLEENLIMAYGLEREEEDSGRIMNGRVVGLMTLRPLIVLKDGGCWEGK